MGGVYPYVLVGVHSGFSYSAPPYQLVWQGIGRGVAQLGSARRSGRRGRRFKSSRPDQ